MAAVVNIVGIFLLMGLQSSGELLLASPPKCEIQVGNAIHRCLDDNGDYRRAGYIELSFTGTEEVCKDGIIYTNISVSFPHGFSGVVQVVGIGNVGYILRQFNLRDRFSVSHPFVLRVTGIPTDLEHTSVRSIQRFNSHGESILSPPCQNRDVVLKCRNLLEHVKLFIKHTRPNTLELSVTNSSSDPLKLEIYGRRCQVSCDASAKLDTSCQLTNVTVVQWKNPASELTINGLIASNYCARAVFNVDGQDCCAIYTRSVPVQFVQTMTHTDHNFHVSYFFYYLFVFLVLALVLTIAVYYSTAKRAFRLMSAPSRSAQEPTNIEKLLQHEPSLGDILLVYPRKDEHFMALMGTFRKLLRDYSKKVWDPLEDREVENVASNPARWMQKVLAIPGVKIVLVETTEGILWCKSDQNTTGIDGREMYFPVVSFLNNQPDLSYNYRQLFVVRFDKRRSSDQPMLSLVPLKRYMMPYQLGLLIRDLTDWYADDMETENESAVLHQFNKATEDYQERSFGTNKVLDEHNENG